ncbi:hypothetical protein NL676_008467 [Syzygium grande]|nr:hypothetical protein NL676_008467 [Syzygium grande]
MFDLRIVGFCILMDLKLMNRATVLCILDLLVRRPGVSRMDNVVPTFAVYVDQVHWFCEMLPFLDCIGVSKKFFNHPLWVLVDSFLASWFVGAFVASGRCLGIEKKIVKLQGREKAVVARHEAGHAVVDTAVANLLPGQPRVEKILSLLESDDANVRIHAVKVVANLAAEDGFPSFS